MPQIVLAIVSKVWLYRVRKPKIYYNGRSKMATVRRIEPKEQPYKRKRTAAYCRVSTDEEIQLKSLVNQRTTYQHKIEENEDWEFAGLYVDTGISGTHENNRDQFQALMTACRSGEIDIILTKSISRFARDTVTTIERTRELKALGIDVYFEKENIHSLSADGELMLTLLAAFAQEESHSISDNVKISIRHGFEEGKQHISRLYGYNVKKGTLTPNAKQAKVVVQIFEEYLGGTSISAIATKLNKQNIPAPDSERWSPSAVYKVLTNLRYTGDSLLQKSVVYDVGGHAEKNAGDIDQFYIEGAHEGLVSRELFDNVQAELVNPDRPRKDNCNWNPQFALPLSGKIYCSVCGEVYWHCGCESDGQDYWKCSTNFPTKRCLSPIVHTTYVEKKIAKYGGVQNVKIIEVMADGRLKAEFNDGRQEEFPAEPPEKKYPFSGLIHCGRCGEPYWAFVSDRQFLWQCASKDTNKFKRAKSKSCGNVNVQNSFLEQIAVECGGVGNIADILVGDEIIVKLTNRESRKFEIERPPINSIMICEICGKHYVRTKGQRWRCATAQDKGKKGCSSKSYNQVDLVSLVRECGGFAKVTNVIAQANGKLRIQLKNGESQERNI
jgi:DNA invertase Pin-like site-specific DNA recombinase